MRTACRISSSRETMGCCMPGSTYGRAPPLQSKALTGAEEAAWLRAWHAGDGSCKLWDAHTLTCLHALAGESGGATSCHLDLTGPAESPDLLKTVLVHPPHRPRHMHTHLLSTQRV